MPKWAIATAGSLMMVLLALVSWLLAEVFNSIKTDVNKMSDIVYQVRQDVAVLSARVDTNSKSCNFKKQKNQEN